MLGLGGCLTCGRLSVVGWWLVMWRWWRVSEKSGINCILSLLTRSLPTNVEDGARGTKPMQGILEKNLVMDSNCIIQRQILCSKYLCFAIEIDKWWDCDDYGGDHDVKIDVHFELQNLWHSGIAMFALLAELSHLHNGLRALLFIQLSWWFW